MGPPSTLHDRVVFVSNLPLHMQWHELKDLLRPAGLIIRADVATDGDGRPRGFGTALFGTEADALAAVNMFNDAEIGGRRVRVSLERDIIQETISRRGSAVSFAQTLEQNQGRDGSQGSQRGSTDGNVSGNGTPPRPWAAEGIPPDAHAPVRPQYNEQPPHPPHAAQGGHPPHHPHHRQHHPGPIAMPSFPPLQIPGDTNTLSPLQTRNLPPMTPSMPGFVFNAYPDTPPIHRLASAAGPFSPGIPVTSPSAFQYNPFLNPAPGAPVNRFPHAGSAALDTPTTQTFPGNPVHHAGVGVQPSIGQIGDYFPTTGSGLSSSTHPEDDPTSPDSATSVKTVGPGAREASGSVSVSGGGGGEDLAKDMDKLSVGSNETSPPKHPFEGIGTIGRASLDLSASKLNVWKTNSGERRASFGDVVAGRAPAPARE